MFNNVFANKRILITGHTGFKGSWLSLWLLNLGAEVFGYSLYIPSKPSLYESLQLSDHLVSDKQANVGDTKALHQVSLKT